MFASERLQEDESKSASLSTTTPLKRLPYKD